MNAKKRNLVIAYLNCLGLLVVIVVNALANILPLNGISTGDVSDSVQNLFVPAPVTFSIWGLIYLLLAVYVITQLVRARSEAAVSEGPDASLWFFLSCVANTLWIFAWHWQYFAWSLACMLVLLGSLIVLYLRLRNSHVVGSKAVVWNTMIPISVYLGWITVATIANTAAVLVDARIQGGMQAQVFWTGAVLVAAVLVNVLAIILQHDHAFALVGVWALLGIVIRQVQQPSGPVALVLVFASSGAGILLLLVILNWLRKKSKVST